ncbi:AAA family ATPase [Thioalkalivibrio sp.]|uniref:ATP-binding protein n=1 Tax=Thioalkalivibrio sp. TaxID=2093813 RepID=UPI003976EA00
MRLRRLDLLRYGHFTGRSIDFPSGAGDLHLVFGPNEAGKSTALAAIEDLLFGIPMQSDFNFLHEYREMRLGAVLESGTDTLCFLRRKGTRDTVLGPDELPLPGGESVLHPFLAGADRPFFERMFSLDHRRLEQGGREILDARDEIGRMLFAAGAGIADLRQRLTALEQEADGLWGPRRASKRLYTRAADRLEAADRELREQTVTATQWEERRAAVAAAEETHAELEEEYVRVQAEGRRLARIRRVHRDVRRKAELARELAAMGRPMVIPEDAEEQRLEAEARALEASTRIQTLADRIRETREELKGLNADAALLLRGDEVRLLHERRIEMRRARGDLPKRQAELAAAESRLLALATDLGWSAGKPDAVIAALPSRVKLGLARSLLAERGEITSGLAVARESLREAEERRRRVLARLESAPAPPDRGGLAARVATVRGQGDLVGRMQTASGEREQARLGAEGLHTRMRPAVGRPEDLVDLPVPARAEVQRMRDLLLEWEQRDRDLRRQMQDAEEEFLRLRRTLERASRDGAELSGEELAEARRDRDRIWELVERRHIRGETLPAQDQARFADVPDDLAGHFRSALLKADAIADRRFERAETVGRLTQLADAVEMQREAVAALSRRLETLAGEGAELRREWRALWAPARLEPLAPDAMLAWLESRDEVLQLLRSRDEAAVRLAALQKEEQRARDGLIGEFRRHGRAQETEAQPLPVLLQRGVDLLHALEQAEGERLRAEEDLRAADDEVERRRREAERAEAARDGWQQRWENAIGDLGLRADADAAEIARQLDTVEALQSLAAQIRNLRHDRIEKIQGDIEAFTRLVRAFVEEVAPELAEHGPEEAVVEIEGRLEAARETRKRQQDRAEQVRRLEEEMAATSDQQRQAQATLTRLMEAAGVDSTGDLRAAIERATRARRLRGELDSIVRMLEQEGDGLPVAELERECADADVDRAAAREQAIEQELRHLRARLEAAVENRASAREAFAAIGGDDAAARVAADREEALAGMRETAERYVRARTAAQLLKWAIDRFRREKQAPMLRRAGEIFASLTGGAFSALRVDYDDRDQPQLTGVRPGGASVPVPGLSTGTADQLYLALRVASIEDYLEHSPALPFVADDLFVNFDDERSAAGFEVLGQLATRTQVLFFTHHRHLVEIARERLGERLHVQLLADA